MSDKKVPGFDDLDWDAALDEWEKTAFDGVFDEGKDQHKLDTKPPAASAQAAGAPRPLYKPEPKTEALPPRRAGEAPALPPEPSPADLEPRTAPPTVLPHDLMAPIAGDDEDDRAATRIASAPPDLKRVRERSTNDEKPLNEKHPRSKGGLGQLFAQKPQPPPRAPEKREGELFVPLFEEPPSTAPVEIPVDEDREPSETVQRQALGAADTQEAPASPEMFDPFGDSSGRVRAVPPVPASRPQTAEVPAARKMSSDAPTKIGTREELLAAEAAATQHASEPRRIHGPSARVHDPDEETRTLERDFAAKLTAQFREDPSFAPTTKLTDDLSATIARSSETRGAPEPPRVSSRPPSKPPVSRVPAEPGAAWEDERPAAAHLDEWTRSSFVERAEWLEAEARAASDRHVRARGLVAVSEIHAILGDMDRAGKLAAEARELSPQLPFASRQMRWLAPTPRDPGKMVEALDLEVRHSPTPDARVHASLMAADVLRTTGDDDEGAKRWEQAHRLAPNDPRPALARAIRAIARGDLARATQRVPESEDLALLAEAIRTVLRLRGADRVDPPIVPLPSEGLRRARVALERGDVQGAVSALAGVRIPGFESSALWLAAALGAVRASARSRAAELLASLAKDGDELARRALAARAIEIEDGARLRSALDSPEAFTPGERAVLAVLADVPLEDARVALPALEATPEMSTLAAALGALRGEPTGTFCGNPTSQKMQRLAAALAAGRPNGELEDILGERTAELPPLARALALELSVRAGRFGEVSDAIERWPAPDGMGARDKELAAGLVAERAGNVSRAVQAYRAARRAAPGVEAPARALLSLEPDIDAAAELAILADELGDDPRAAILRIEAVARVEGVDDTVRADLLDRAHRAAPSLPIAAFLAERIARRTGDVEEVLRWIRERRAAATDPIEAALDGVREALLIADRDPELASERLAEAHRARVDDVALRELFERLATDPPADRAVWREQRAAKAADESKALLFTEAAHEYERAGDPAGALRTAMAAIEAGDRELAQLSRDRAELDTGAPERLTEELLAKAKASEDAVERRETYERLAELDATVRSDISSALSWHRKILEETPQHMPSLRFVEHTLLGAGRDEELEPVATSIARMLKGSPGGECSAHAWLAARFRMRTDLVLARDVVDLAADQAEPPLWAIRLQNALARAAKDDEAMLRTYRALAERSTKPVETAILLLRGGEAAGRLERVGDARDLLDRASTEDPGDVVTWGFLVEVRERLGDTRAAAEACESLARTSVVSDHQLLAWYDAARMWQDEVKDTDRALLALENAAMIDVAYEDVFDRLALLYKQRGQGSELASLLERRITRVQDPAQRVAMEVQRGMALLDLGDEDGARRCLESALAEEPDRVDALRAMGDLCARLGDWAGAEQAWIRLARLLSEPEEQKAVYARLGELYAVHAVNLSRAEVALKEVLKRDPNDSATLARLVDVYKRQNDPARAIEAQQQLIARATEPDARLARLIELASIYETAGRDLRKAEQTLESARKEFPIAVGALRALAEFYQRQRQMPAMHILLDRAAADARRAFAGGRFVPSLFQILAAVADLRGKKDAARVVNATLAAFEGHPATLRGAELRALDPRLDDLLAPEAMGPALRALLARTGDALDATVPADLRGMRAAPLPPSAAPTGQMLSQLAGAVGLGNVQILSSPSVGKTVMPCTSSPPVLVLGDSFLATTAERQRAFLVIRALKLVLARASALIRVPPADMPVLVAAWFRAFNPTWVAPGVNAGALADMSRRLAPAIPRQLDADVGVIALEAAANLGTNAPALGAAALAWANRVALLAVGDPGAALDAIAWTQGAEGAPAGAEARATWIARTVEARDLIAFSVSDAYAEARARLGLDKV